MGRNLLGLFDAAAVLQIHGDARRPEAVVTGTVAQACRHDPAFHHRQRFTAAEASSGQPPPAVEGAKERTIAIAGDAGRG